jgi:hypothetical protein
MSPPPSAPPRGPRSPGGSARSLVLPLVPGLDRPRTGRRPLPDAAAVRLVPVPEAAPPYDDEPAAPELEEPGRPRRLTLATTAQAVNDSGRAQDVPAAADRAPRTAEWPSQFAQVLAETLAGSRSQGQIAPWTTDQARKRIRQLGPMLATGVQPHVRRIVTSRPTASVVEMTVIVGFGPKIRALAVRLEQKGPCRASPGRTAKPARWVCTAIEAA